MKTDISSQTAKKKILIVEDATSMRLTLKASLRNMGFENLIEASDGQKALKLMKTKSVDLIISDWMMPNLSGLELFNEIKKDKNLNQIPFILLTGNDQKEGVTQAIKTGIKHYIVKPFSPNKLFEKMVELLEQQNKVDDK